MAVFPYKEYDGIGLAELIRNREVTAEEVIDAAIAEIEKKNHDVNAVINKMYDKAKGKAEQFDLSGEFSGVPILLKNIAQEIKDGPITNGSRAYCHYKAAEDSTFVERIRKTGTIFIGQTNIPELALMGITEPAFYGPTRNPWNLNYTPGGSSGGSAAAVASGMVPIAGANDGGGSIRIPAAFTGLFGLKPTRGRTPVGKKEGRHWQGAAVDHVLTRTVRDSALMLDLIKGYERSAAFHTGPYEVNYFEAVKTPFPRPMRIAFSTISPIGTEVDPECKEAVYKAVKILESFGHIVEEKNAPVDGKKLAKSFMTLYFGEVAASLKEIEEMLGRKVRIGDVEPSTYILGLLGKATTAEDFVLSIREWDKAAIQMETFHDTYDFYVTPTTAYPPSKIGELDITSFENYLIHIIGTLHLQRAVKKLGIVDQMIENNLKRTPFTQMANLTGQPAMSVPLHVTNKGLPVGVQFLSAKGREDLLFQMAGLLEQTDAWIDVKKNEMF
ncbi:amidase family protein [Niallia oryzisoli]|uniref:Amidase family protein n=1 Tax=Niallia oryzisoli TaxID=1737571 RepID=A0ABZ2CNE9_9BACI